MPGTVSAIPSAVSLPAGNLHLQDIPRKRLPVKRPVGQRLPEERLPPALFLSSAFFRTPFPPCRQTIASGGSSSIFFTTFPKNREAKIPAGRANRTIKDRAVTVEKMASVSRTAAMTFRNMSRIREPAMHRPSGRSRVLADNPAPVAVQRLPFCMALPEFMVPETAMNPVVRAPAYGTRTGSGNNASPLLPERGNPFRNARKSYPPAKSDGWKRVQRPF